MLKAFFAEFIYGPLLSSETQNKNIMDVWILY